MVPIALVVIMFELFEGHELNDVHLWREIILYTFAFFAVWLLFTLLANSLIQQARREEAIEQHWRFRQHLAQHIEWDELVKFVLHFPAMFFPVDRTVLFLYDHRHAHLKFITQWDISQGMLPPISPSLIYDPCRTCLLARPPQMHASAQCGLPLGSMDDHGADVFCLPLIYNNVLVGVLRLRCQFGKTLTQDQIGFINASLSEIALALILSIAHPRQMAQMRTEAQLDAQNQIAYELHNSLAQQIGYLHLSLDRLTGDERLLQDDSVRDELEHMRVAAGQAYEQIRNTLARLRLREIANLSQAIADHARLVAQTANLQIEFTTQGEPYALPAEMCQQIFGLVGEGLNNVEKHAQAQHVQIPLVWSDDSLCISVVDDGEGFFAASAPSQEGHYGLLMMRERVEALGGTLTLESSPGKGTRLSLRIPLQRLPAHPNRETAFANLDVST